MSGYCYGEPEPTENCPYCGQECWAIFVDIGVGMQQVAPFACEGCHAVQIGPYDKERPLTEQEIKTGWYEPQVSISDPAAVAQIIEQAKGNTDE